MAREWSALIKRGVDPAQAEEKAREEQAEVRSNTFGAIVLDYFDRADSRDHRSRYPQQGGEPEGG
jgi:hypothetical protein